ncbi:MAG: hypothetical protein IRZ26_08460 [Clostridia bacterium]|nr:hypothetical protein [Clostridia bacterium]
MPPVRPATLPAEYRQSGGFVYTASAAPGPVYPDGQVKNGDPVFLNLTHVVRFTFDYRFQSAFPHRISGRASLTAVLQGSSGWSRSFPLQPETPFQGDEVRLQGSLDLARLAEIVAQVQAATGLQNEQYKLVLEPHVQAGGLLGGSALAAGFDPQLNFNFTPVMLSPVTGAPGGSGADPFRPAETATVALAREAPATLGVGRLQVPVEGLRLAMPAALLLALAALVLSWLQFLHEGRRPEPERIRALYGDFLAEARDLGLDERPRVVWVADMASLARLAAQYERLVLHQEAPDGSHLYAVEDTDCVYCYRTGSWLDGAGSFPAGEPSPAQPASEVHP